MNSEQPNYILEVGKAGEVRTVYQWLAKDQPEGMIPEVDEAWKGIKFKTLIIDTFTQFHHYLLEEICPPQGSTIPQPKIQDWGELLRKTNWLLDRLQRLDMHVILTVQSEETEDSLTGAIAHRPQLWGKSRKEVPAFVYIHMYLIQAFRVSKSIRAKLGVDEENLKAEDRIGFLTPRFDSMGKDQTGSLGSFLLNPTIPMMVDLIYPPAVTPTTEEA